MALAWSAEPQRSVTILGATGSVGRSTLDLIASAPERYRVEALTGHRNVEGLAALAVRHRARLAVIGDPAGYRRLAAAGQWRGLLKVPTIGRPTRQAASAGIS